MPAASRRGITVSRKCGNSETKSTNDTEMPQNPATKLQDLLRDIARRPDNPVTPESARDALALQFHCRGESRLARARVLGDVSVDRAMIAKFGRVMIVIRLGCGARVAAHDMHRRVDAQAPTRTI